MLSLDAGSTPATSTTFICFPFWSNLFSLPANQLPMAKETKQTTRHILMVRPAHFCFNPETAGSNAFQSEDSLLSSGEISRRAIEEFDSFVATLRSEGVDVIVAQDTDHPVKPDAVFPNNWVTFHEDGTVVTYPMLSAARRLERREDVLQSLAERFEIKRHIHLEAYEQQGKILEGTGSMIIDRPNALVYACVSPRTNPELLAEFAQLMGYQPVLFKAVDAEGMDIYHTNVMMALGETFVVICRHSISSENEWRELSRHFEKTGKEVIEITLPQMMSFAGNMLQIRGKDDERLLVMSSEAYGSLEESQVETLERHTRILHHPIPTIEKFGGGSVRCMMAEVFLPEK